MIRHIVWWTLKPQAEGRSASENAALIQQSSAVLKGIPSVRSVDVSTKILQATTVPAQVVLASTHDGAKELEAYQKDPVHQKFAKLITAVSDSRNCIDYLEE